MIRDDLMYAVHNLRYRKLRSWLTIIGIVIGIAAIVALMHLGAGLENAVREQFEKMGINSIRVVPKGFTGPGSTVEALTTKDVDVIESIPGVDYAEGILNSRQEIKFGNEVVYNNIIGSPVGKSDKVFADLDLEFESGQRYGKGEYNSVVIGNYVAHEMFKKEVKQRGSLTIGGKKFKVAGVLKKTGLELDKQIYMPLQSLRELTGEDEKVTGIRVQIKKGEDIKVIAKKIESKLKRSRDDEAFQVFTPEQLLTQIGSILDIIRFILAGIAAISLVVGGIGIMNAMYTSVKERTREIGVMKAVGATNYDVAMMFVVESGLIGMVGGVIGVVIGLAMAFSVEGIAAQLGFALISIKADVEVIVFALVFAFVVGMLSGFMPAIRAAKMVPVEALRYE
ncbi:ABC transporter permease [Candidatus Woesearchaeota archaeon]|nr:MAG: ABC transporter permease [Candidatus Woesearchaeota archaeon]